MPVRGGGCAKGECVGEEKKSTRGYEYTRDLGVRIQNGGITVNMHLGKPAHANLRSLDARVAPLLYSTVQ